VLLAVCWTGAVVLAVRPNADLGSRRPPGPTDDHGTTWPSHRPGTAVPGKGPVDQTKQRT
jgi:hypothetical protein